MWAVGDQLFELFSERKDSNRRVEDSRIYPGSKEKAYCFSIRQDIWIWRFLSNSTKTLLIWKANQSCQPSWVSFAFHWVVKEWLIRWGSLKGKPKTEVMLYYTMQYINQRLLQEKLAHLKVNRLETSHWPKEVGIFQRRGEKALL